jgi:hypothetical protein
MAANLCESVGDRGIILKEVGPRAGGRVDARRVVAAALGVLSHQRASPAGDLPERAAARLNGITARSACCIVRLSA